VFGKQALKFCFAAILSRISGAGLAKNPP